MSPPNGPGDPPVRVAIVGGGPASLAAAWTLSDPALEGRYEVTVHQMGWRLGGKCASGRDLDHCSRILEHGLHVWFGCYDNAFGLMRECYAALGRKPGIDPLATVDEAFLPCSDAVIWDFDGQDWEPHLIRCPQFGTAPADFHEVVTRALAFVAGLLRDLQDADPAVDAAVTKAPPVLPSRTGLDGAAPEVVRPDGDVVPPIGFADALQLAAERAGHEAAGGQAGQPGGGGGEDDDGPPGGPFGRFVDVADGALGWLETHVLGAFPGGHRGVAFVLSTGQLVRAAVAGILDEQLLTEGFDKINAKDVGEWLHSHGAALHADRQQDNPFLRAIYSGSFAFRDGNCDTPEMAAGRALQGMVRVLFHYHDAVLHRMAAGMGDAVIAPLYLGLKDRGVNFEFFHAAANVNLQSGRAAEVTFIRQVELKGNTYAPLVEVPFAGRSGLLPCWPSAPLWDQVVGGEPAPEGRPPQEVDTEHVVDPFGGPTDVLEAGRDFDVLVLGVPPEVQKTMCTGTLAPGHVDLLRTSQWVATQAVQLWLRQKPQELGWPWTSNSLMSTYREPLDTYCDMCHLIPCETFPPGTVHHIAYFCGVMPNALGDDVAEAEASVRDQAQRFLDQDAGRFWPDAVTRKGFDWGLLVTPPGAAAAGRDPLDAQYLRANVQASERYVLTPPGESVAARLYPGRSGYDNVVLAGDWTRNGFDAGCVEAAVTSGLLAARAICGRPALAQIAGLGGPPGFPDNPEGWDGDDPNGFLGAGSRPLLLSDPRPSH